MFAEAPINNPNGMQILTACPLCQANYNPLKTQIMAESEDAHLIYLQCRQCGSSVMAVVTAGNAGLSSVGAVTDLTSQEVASFQDKPEVTTDDLLELHRWLAKPEQRFSGLQLSAA